MMKPGRIVDSGSPKDLIAKYGRTTLEDVFLDVARRGPLEAAHDGVGISCGASAPSCCGIGI